MPVLLQAHAGARETLRPGAGACQGTNLTAKRGLKAPFVAKTPTHIAVRRKFFVREGGLLPGGEGGPPRAGFAVGARKSYAETPGGGGGKSAPPVRPRKAT